MIRKELVQRSRGVKEPSRPPKYRRGRVQNIGASLQPPRPDPNAGRIEKENAQFLESMNKFVFKQLVPKVIEDDRERGIASFTRANAEQREAYKNAINNGWIDSKESPYFREGVTNAYTDNLTTKAFFELERAYERWPDKNNPSSEALKEFFQEQDDLININLESIPDDILKDRFNEPYQSFKRQLARRHSAYLNGEYTDKANDQLDLKFYNFIKNNAESLGLDLDSEENRNRSLKEILDNQKLFEANSRVVAKELGHSKNNLSQKIKNIDRLCEEEGNQVACTLRNNHFNNTNPNQADDLHFDSAVSPVRGNLVKDPEHDSAVSPVRKDIDSERIKDAKNNARSYVSTNHPTKVEDIIFMKGPPSWLKTKKNKVVDDTVGAIMPEKSNENKPQAEFTIKTDGEGVISLANKLNVTREQLEAYLKRKKPKLIYFHKFKKGGKEIGKEMRLNKGNFDVRELQNFIKSR